ncbi:DNA-binding transcriptional LysR family regulator [Thermocatellispora tengchongensis]|uniref:DNA-binding transcriptional LysR family regulator n=1 Tax=Thermocatellispora tengchongensis TaxID=1073253 RepID=A0A840NX93_9ACTN|nr:LysR family transcriptional regulator [Thermocatellispora tengchongensis]MBB5133464.1 DNA-binding transcriptional LysR family regulator [Thermocatellispora tengchongensis]
MRGISFDLLRTFLAVHRSGSVSRAAELLGLSQPTVTAHVKSLERDLGRPLFERVPRGMAPTPAADQLAARVGHALDALEELVLGDLSGPAETFGRAVHLGGPAELVCARVLPCLAPLVSRGLHLRVTLGLPDGLLTALADGSLDLVISSVRPRRRGLRVEPLGDEEFALVAAPGWTFRDVDRAPLVAYAENLPILRRYWRTVFDTRLTRQPAVVVPDLRGVLAAVTAGAGITVLPVYLCATELADGRLHLLHRPELPPINTLFLATRAGGAHPAAAAVRERLLAHGPDLMTPSPAPHPGP